MSTPPANNCVECYAVWAKRGNKWPPEWGQPPATAEPCPRCEKMRCEGHELIHEVKCSARRQAKSPRPDLRVVR